MSESNRSKNQDRWQELADQLGLPGESPQAPAAKEEMPAKAPAERPAPAPRQEVPYEETDDSFALTPAPRERAEAEARHSRPEARPEPSFQPEDVQVEVFAETAVIQTESTPDSASAEEAEGPPSEGENQSMRTAGRRRRRRRSSGKSKKEASDTPVAQESSDQQEGADSEPETLAFTAPDEQPGQPSREESTGESGHQRGRNRGRGGRRRREEEPEAAEVAAVDEDEVQESGGAVGFEEDNDDEEIANYANWSVPSWKDLIASLYRPER